MQKTGVGKAPPPHGYDGTKLTSTSPLPTWFSPPLGPAEGRGGSRLMSQAPTPPSTWQGEGGQRPRAAPPAAREASSRTFV